MSELLKAGATISCTYQPLLQYYYSSPIHVPPFQGSLQWLPLLFAWRADQIVLSLNERCMFPCFLIKEEVWPYAYFNSSSLFRACLACNSVSSFRFTALAPLPSFCLLLQVVPSLPPFCWPNG